MVTNCLIQSDVFYRLCVDCNACLSKSQTYYLTRTNNLGGVWVRGGGGGGGGDGSN